tara:strand:+ start:816 stop:944 length:129 start_codon:yes stop_codon:yes gene_type:complete
MAAETRHDLFHAVTAWPFTESDVIMATGSDKALDCLAERVAC